MQDGRQPAPGHLRVALVALAPPWHYRGWMGLLLAGAALARWDQGWPWDALGNWLPFATRQELAAMLD